MNFRLVCKYTNILLEKEHFWKMLMERNFDDINKLKTETWKCYYKRRFIKYGTPIIFNKTNDQKILCFNDDELKNDVLQFYCNEDRSTTVYLNKKYQVEINFDDDYDEYGSKLLYCKDSFAVNKQFLHHRNNIIKIILSEMDILFFIDSESNLYQYDFNFAPKLVSKDVIDIFTRCAALVQLYYTKKCGTYSIACNENFKISKVFNAPLLFHLKTIKCEYYLTQEHEFIIDISKGNKYVMKAQKVSRSRMNMKYLLILGLDGHINLFHMETKKRIKINIPNVEILSGNTFLTKNGNLYCISSDLKTILIDTDVTDINFDNNGFFGCYIKRCI
jgi:hypothetical protein